MKSPRPAVEGLVDGVIDNILASGNTADLVNDFALAVPSQVICRIMGVPYEDHVFFKAHTTRQLDNSRLARVQVEAQQAIYSYLDNMITDRLAEPADDPSGSS